MLVLDIRGNARDGSVPEGVGVVEEITKIEPASPSGGKEYVKLHLKEVKSGKERTKYASKTKRVKAKAEDAPEYREPKMTGAPVSSLGNTGGVSERDSAT